MQTTLVLRDAPLIAAGLPARAALVRFEAATGAVRALDLARTTRVRRVAAFVAAVALTHAARVGQVRDTRPVRATLLAGPTPRPGVLRLVVLPLVVLPLALGLHVPGPLARLRVLPWLCVGPLVVLVLGPLRRGQLGVAEPHGHATQGTAGQEPQQRAARPSVAYRRSCQRIKRFRVHGVRLLLAAACVAWYRSTQYPFILRWRGCSHHTQRTPFRHALGSVASRREARGCTVAAIRHALGESKFTTEMAEGRTLPLKRAIAAARANREAGA